jgi:MFS transporter, AAHS family, 3-hydroxyphenylpropionic acid transporter
MRTTLVTLMYSGVPLGGALGGVIGWIGGPAMDWRVIFYVGGVGPLLIAPLLAFALPESRLFQQRAGGERPSASAALFGDGRAATTLLIWASFFCTLLILYLLVNWLPLLLVGQGYTPPDANLITIIFNIGGSTGAIVLGLLMDRASRGLTMLAIYVGMAVALLALARVSGSFIAAAAAGFACGVFVIGAQLVLYGVVPNYYATRVRATGVGAAVAAGRLGSIVGPLVAGELLGAGRAVSSVIFSLLPVVVVAGVTAMLLLRRRAEVD